MALARELIKEEAVAFGARRGLVGVIAEPAGGFSAELPAIILLNAGMLHHIGPNRLNVKIARRLARKGYRSLRFDFSGLGDSSVRKDGMSYAQSTLQELREARELLGAKRVVLVGICSGGKVAFNFALGEEGVAGIVLVESLYFASVRYHLSRLLSLEKWKRFLKGESHLWQVLREKLSRRREGKETSSSPKGSPSQTTDGDSFLLTQAQLKGLLNRGVKPFFIYRAGNETIHNFRIEAKGERLSAKGLNENMRVEFVAEADHTFTLLSSQQRLMDLVEAWLEEQFAGDGSA